MKKRSQGKIVINSERCKGCGLCVWACPEGHSRLSDKEDIRGITMACNDDSHRCTGCRF